MSMVLLGTVSLISCKEPLENDLVGKRDYDQSYDPGPIREINPNGHDDNTGGGGGGSGGSSGGYTSSGFYIVANFNIKVSPTLPPCVKAPVLDVLARIGSADETLRNILQQFSNNGNTFNLVIRTTTSQLMINDNLQAAPAATRKSADGSAWVMILNKDILDGASQEYIAAVLLHELYHIKSEQDGHLDYNHHKYYFSSGYIDNIKQALLSLYGSDTFVEKDAKALALSGVAGGGSTQPYGITVQEILEIEGKFKSTEKGTSRCTN